MRHNQNRRSRGRSRKGPNPLTRSYESNGPDVKVRGTAAHIADKYMTLARDAVSSGDSVSAENYLQHAEHYNRIVMAAQAQFQPSQPQFRDSAEEGYDDRQANGRMRDRFDYNGDGRGEGEGDEPFEAGEGEDDRGFRPQRRPDDMSRQRGPRPHRYEGRDRFERNEPREAADPAAEPQPELREPTAPAAPAAPTQAEEAAPSSSQPRRRRGRPPKAGEGAEAEEDSTTDGAAALAAFPE
ncbi:MAG: DUF4167 domain-containing protein [Propylenella sp.]